jgi:hypothetical protein
LVGVLTLIGLAKGQAPQGERIIQVQEMGKPAQKCRVLKCWRQADGTMACQVQALTGGEIMTIVESEPSPAKGSAKAATGTAKGAATQVFHWGSSASPPAGTPAVPAGAAVLAQPAPTPQPAKGAEPRQSMFSRLFKSNPAPTPAVVMPVIETSQPPTARKDRAAVETARPGDWRESWGKVERYTPPAVEPKTVVQQPAPTLARPILPHAEAHSDDPLQHPELYNRVPPVSPTGKPAAAKPVRVELSQVVSQEKPTPRAPTAGGERSGGLFASFFKSSKPRSASQQTPAADGSQAPPGLASVLAARSPQQPGQWGPGGQPMVSVPDGANAFSSGQPPAPPVMPPFNAFAAGGYPPAAPTGYGPGYPPMMAGMPPGYYPPMRPPSAYMPPARAMVMDSGTPEGLANAFTMGTGSTRPIPADFGPPQQMANAFLDPSAPVTMGSQPRPTAAPGAAPYVAAQAFARPAPRAAYLPPAAPTPAPAAPPAQDKGQLLTVLRDSLYPSERETAAERLAGCNWHSEPEVVQALVQAARHDPAPLVRAGCVRSLGRMKANSIHVVNAVQALKADTDPRVRQEVEQALPVLLAP